MRTGAWASIAVIAGAAGIAGAATFTTVNIGTGAGTRGAVLGGGTGAPSTEGGTNNSIVNIMSRMYLGTTDGDLAGVTGHLEGLIDFGNGVTARRIADADVNPLTQVLHLHLGSAGAVDQVWRDGVVSFVARARYAGYDQYFGYREGLTAGGFTGGGFAVSSGFDSGPGGILNIGSPVDLQWMRANNAAGTVNPHYSYDANNVAGRDQMVAWEVFGMGGGRRYVLGFEDINKGGSPDDRDFNDLVIELAVIIPLPSAGGMALAGLGVLALRRRREV